MNIDPLSREPSIPVHKSWMLLHFQAPSRPTMGVRSSNEVRCEALGLVLSTPTNTAGPVSVAVFSEKYYSCHKHYSEASLQWLLW